MFKNFSLFFLAMFAPILSSVKIHSNFVARPQLKSFKIFNALLYHNTPDLSSAKFHKIFMFYEEELLEDNNRFPDDFSKRSLSQSKIKNVALKSLEFPNVPVCLDIESWGLDDINRKKSLQKYLDVLKIFKSINNKSKIGYFGVYPMSSPHAPYYEGGDLRDKLIIPKWHESNNYVQKVATSTKVFFPEFYTRNKNRLIWRKIVEEKVAKIKSVNSHAKIYGVIWPQYYSSDGKYPFIEKEVWLSQLETIFRYCDGAVIWSHYNGPDGKPIRFSTEMDWFTITEKFLKDHNIR